MKMNRELKWWEKLLKRLYIPYIKFSYYRDAFDDWRIEICRAGWRFQPKEYYPSLDDYWAEILERNIQFWERLRLDPETGAHTRRGPMVNRDLGDEA